MSDETHDYGRRPENNAKFQDLCRRGCRMWRLSMENRRDVSQRLPQPSLDAFPYKNEELIIVCKCGDLRQDRYTRIPSDRTFSVSISIIGVVHWMTQSVQDTLSLSIWAFKGLIPCGHLGALAVEISEETGDCGRMPKDNAEFQDLCRSGCRMWRLLIE